MKRKCRDDRGFLSLKTGLMTAGAFLATASMGTAILVGLPEVQSTNVFTDDKSGFCVTATLENDDSYFAQRGNCGNEETPEPEPLPEVPEITPEPTPTPEPEPVLPPEPPPIIIDTGKIMVTTWDTSLAPTCQTITLPISGIVDTQIQWTHGSSPENIKKINPSHTFTAPYGPVEITINGTFDNWGTTSNSDGWADSICLVSVDRWGGTETKNLSYAFYNADYLKHVAAIPSTTTDLSFSFAEIARNPTIGNLQTSNVKTMKSMFQGATVFNQPLYFDTAQVSNMERMFYRSSKFNQPLNFNTSQVTNMTEMFRTASNFDQPLSFDTSNVTTMHAMFYNASLFNSALNFNTSKVLRMDYMFYGAFVFNQPLNFDTSKVTNMTSMFWEANLYNQNLSHWDVNKVTQMHGFTSQSYSWTLPKPNFKK